MLWVQMRLQVGIYLYKLEYSPCMRELYPDSSPELRVQVNL